MWVKVQGDEVFFFSPLEGASAEINLIPSEIGKNGSNRA